MHLKFRITNPQIQFADFKYARWISSKGYPWIHLDYEQVKYLASMHRSLFLTYSPDKLAYAFNFDLSKIWEKILK